VFVSSRPVTVLDYLRVPYAVDSGTAATAPHSLGRLHRAGSPDSASLLWPVAVGAEATAPPRPRRFRLGTLTLHARVQPDERLQPALDAVGSGWTRALDVLGENGERVGSVFRASDGSIALPFDPDEVVGAFWSEAYAASEAGTVAGRLKRTTMRVYYRARPLLPRRVQVSLRRRYSRVQARRSFPAWPVESSLHDFYDLLLQWLAEVANSPVPWIAPWPNGYRSALVLTHDVETAAGLRRVDGLRDIEAELGFRSSWNLVPGRYEVPDELVAGLLDDGFEVGVHGLYHDGRDLENAETLRHRLPAMRAFAERCQAVGFRSPATHRGWDLMQMLPFDYDSSYPDTDPFEPQGGGCASWLPYFIGPLVELPITMPQDHTLFVILRHRDGQAWLEKAQAIRDRGGMVLAITHPDYLPDGPVADSYRRLLAQAAADRSVWCALPREVSAWWRRRAASWVQGGPSGWHVVGPAADEATVALASARTVQAS
jgi:hypothetical protein